MISRGEFLGRLAMLVPGLGLMSRMPAGPPPLTEVEVDRDYVNRLVPPLSERELAGIDEATKYMAKAINEAIYRAYFKGVD